jgi:anaerobic selenocysteine-containing dehydrogenase
LVKVRDDDAHPASKGYACEKPHRIDFYQNGPHRLTKPIRRRNDGSFEEIDWDTAIAEVAGRFSACAKSTAARRSSITLEQSARPVRILSSSPRATAMIHLSARRERQNRGSPISRCASSFRKPALVFRLVLARRAPLACRFLV